MDSKKEDNSKIRQREEILARRVGEALDQMDPHGASGCPDAEVIAAYAEQALAPSESAQWESHFATCSRCRKILRVLAASSDAPLGQQEIVRLGEQIAAASSAPAAPKPSSGGWRAKWQIRWLAPALGVAAVLAVWFAMRAPLHTGGQVASPTLVAQAPKEEIPAPSAQSMPANKPSDKASNQISRSENSTASNRPFESLKQKENDTETLAIPAPAPQDESAKRVETPSAPPPAVSLQSDAIARQAQAEAGAPAPATAPANPLPVKKSPAQQQTSEGLAIPPLSSRLMPNPGGNRSISAFKSASATPVVATSPFGSTIWRAGSGGRIEYSADSGQSWTTQVSPVQKDWLAGVAVSDTVCWLAGRNGSIARTTDGEHWERVTPPALAADANGKMPDWTAITGRSAQSATVTASSGRRFVTSDGGATWQTQ